jgi:RhtB (resistance to homoserine/threonine) family protein
MIFLTQFITVAVVHFLAVASPGPDFAMVTRNSLMYTRKVGLYTSLGIALGVLVHVGYSLLGLGLLISQSILLFNAIKFVGAGYLIYIGIKSLRASRPVEDSQNVIKKEGKVITFQKSVWIGFLTCVLNPKATLFFLALFTQVIDLSTPKTIQFLYGIEMMIITFIWFTFVSVVFSNSLIKSRVGKVQHYIERVTGAVLIALGIKVAFSHRN